MKPNLPTQCVHMEAQMPEVGQVIAVTNFDSFLKPDMASKNDARHGIGLSQY